MTPNSVDSIARVTKSTPRWSRVGLSFTTLCLLMTGWFAWLLVGPMIRSVTPDQPLLVACTGSGYGFVNESGDTVVPFRWSYCNRFNNLGLAKVHRKQKLGWINRRGELVIPCEYNSAFDFHGGYWIASKDGKSGVLDQYGRTVVPFEWERIDTYDQLGYARVWRNGKCGCVDRSGQLLIPLEWTTMDRFDAAGMANVIKNNRTGWIDHHGNQVIPCEWQLVWDFDQNGLAAVVQRKGVGLIDRKGSIVIPCEWNQIWPCHVSSNYLVQKNNKWGWIDRTGKVIIDLTWDSAGPFHQSGLAVVGRDNQYGAIDAKGKLIIPLSYDFMGNFGEIGLADVNSKRKWGAVNTLGTPIVPIEWDQIGTFHEIERTHLFTFDATGFAQVQRDSKWGWVDDRGKNVIPCQFTKASPFNGHGLSIVVPERDSVEAGVIDRSGKWIVKPGNHQLDLSDSGYINSVRSNHPLCDVPVIANLINYIPYLKKLANTPLYAIINKRGQTVWRSDTHAARAFLPYLLATSSVLTLVSLCFVRRSRRATI